MKKLVIFILAMTLLTACGEKKLDLTSEDSFRTSVVQISENLTKTEQEAFVKAIMKITIAATVEANYDDVKGKAILKEKLNGKTASQVITMANNIKDPFVGFNR